MGFGIQTSPTIRCMHCRWQRGRRSKNPIDSEQIVNIRTGTEGEGIQERPVITISMVSLDRSSSEVKINSRERQCLEPRDPIGQLHQNIYGILLFTKWIRARTEIGMTKDWSTVT